MYRDPDQDRNCDVLGRKSWLHSFYHSSTTAPLIKHPLIINAPDKQTRRKCELVATIALKINKTNKSLKRNVCAVYSATRSPTSSWSQRVVHVWTRMQRMQPESCACIGRHSPNTGQALDAGYVHSLTFLIHTCVFCLSTRHFLSNLLNSLQDLILQGAHDLELFRGKRNAGCNPANPVTVPKSKRA